MSRSKARSRNGNASQNQPNQPSGKPGPQGQQDQPDAKANPGQPAPPQRGTPGQTPPNGGRPAAPSSETDTGLGRVEDKFRVLKEQTLSSLREQADAFDSVMQTALGAIGDRTRLATEKASLQSVVDKLTEERNNLRDALQAADRERAELRGTKERLEKQQAELTAAGKQLGEQLESATRSNSELKAANQTFQQNFAESQQKTEKQQAQISEITAANVQLESAGREVEQKLAEQQAATRQQEARAESAESANLELEQERQSLKEQFTEASTNLQAVSSRVESVEGCNRDLQKKKVELEQLVGGQRARVSELEGQLDASGREQEEMRSANRTLHDQIASLNADCEALREQAEAADAEQQKLAATRATLESCLADLSEKAQDLGTDRREPDLRRATEKEMNELRARIAELEGAEAKLAEYQAQITELQSKVAELEAALKDAPNQPAAASVGDGGSIMQELAGHARCAQQLAEGLQQPKIDGSRHKDLVRVASELAVQLDLLKMTAELRHPETAVELTTEQITLSDTMQSTLEMVASGVARKGLGLTHRMDPAVPGKVYADADRLQQLLTWATTFVTRHACEGDIAVSVTAASNDRGECLRFQLFNDGVGLSTEQIEAILKPPTSSENGRGDDVDCFARVADAMGGSVRVEAAGKQGFAVWIEIELKAVEPGKGDRRDSDRILQELLQCNFGPVVDVSSTGMRIVSQKNLRGKVVVELGDSLPPLKLRAQIVWTNKIDRKQYEIGLRFTHVRPAEVEQLLRIANKHGLSAAG